MTFITGSIDKRAAISRESKERDYWFKQLTGDWVKTGFIYDYKKENASAANPGKIRYTLAGELFTRLMKLRNEADINLHIILLSGVVALLNIYTGKEDIIVGTPVLKQEIEDNFINTVLPIRQRVEEPMTFKELLLQTRQTVVEATENQNCPIETLFYQLNKPSHQDNDNDNDRESDQSYGFPLFDVAVLLENIHGKHYIDYTHPDILFSSRRVEDEAYIEGVVEYRTDLYKQTTIETIVRHFIHLLEEAIFNPE